MYDYASDQPLVLHHCNYENVRWQHSVGNLTALEAVLHRERFTHLMRTCVVESYLRHIATAQVNVAGALAGADAKVAAVAVPSSSPLLRQYEPWKVLRTRLAQVLPSPIVYSTAEHSHSRSSATRPGGGYVPLMQRHKSTSLESRRTRRIENNQRVAGHDPKRRKRESERGDGEGGAQRPGEAAAKPAAGPSASA